MTMERIGDLAKFPPREMAIRSCRDGVQAFAPCKIPDIPGSVSHVTPKDVADWRRQGWPNDCADLVQQWHEAVIARSGAVADNISRLRGAMWCLTALRRVLAHDPSDSEAEQHADTLTRYLEAVWGVTAIPETASEQHAMAEKIVRTRAGMRF